MRHWRSIGSLKFIETRVFTRQITALASDDEYRLLQESLLRRPAHGVVIKGTGGIRKLRWGDQSRGKRGGLRVIYYWHVQRELFLMLYTYSKNEQKDLTADQKAILARAVRQEFE